MTKKAIFEVLVDRENEKGPGAFEHILIILHKILEKDKRKFIFFKTYSRPSFSFEIAKIGNKIRFFIFCEEKYSEFLKNQIYAHYSNIEIIENSKDYMENIPNENILVANVKLEKHYLYSIKSFTQLQELSTKDTIDPYSSITSSLSKIGKNSVNVFQVNFSPYPDSFWKNKSQFNAKILSSKYPEFIKKFFLSKYYLLFKISLFPIYIIIKLLSFLANKSHQEEEHNEIDKEIDNKIKHFGYGVSINIVCASQDNFQNKLNLKEIVSTLGVYSFFGQNSFKINKISNSKKIIKKAKDRKNTDDMILSTQELSGLVHMPTTYVKTPSINWVLARNFEPPSNLPFYDENQINEITPIGKTNFRHENINFGLLKSDRRRHMYIIGKTGMGKSTLLENMIIDDIHKGRGVAVIDPHGDLAENIIGHIPKSRTNQVIIFDPSDKNFPIAFNMFDGVSKEHYSLVASGLISIFKKIFGESWGPRLEHTLRNTILALLEYPNTTLISIPLMLTSEYYRGKVVEKITDPVVRKFWLNEFGKMSDTQKIETSSPILNKVGQFLSSSILRNILGQQKNSFSLRWAMDNSRIVIIKLPKGIIGEDSSSLLGAMMVSKFQLDAMSRADILESERKDFYLYVDEFQNFATDSFATILSEARKYKLNLVMANQYIDQMTETVKGAVFGNVGSLVSFQVGFHDSSILKDVLGGEISSQDLTNLKKYSIYTKLLIDGMPSKVFSADTFSPKIRNEEEFKTRYQKILLVSREKYSQEKKIVEQKIFKTINDVEIQEKKIEEYKLEQKLKKEKEREEKLLKLQRKD